jgi:hypothetical protein
MGLVKSAQACRDKRRGIRWLRRKLDRRCASASDRAQPKQRSDLIQGRDPVVQNKPSRLPEIAL